MLQQTLLKARNQLNFHASSRVGVMRVAYRPARRVLFDSDVPSKRTDRARYAATVLSRYESYEYNKIYNLRYIQLLPLLWIGIDRAIHMHKTAVIEVGDRMWHYTVLVLINIFIFSLPACTTSQCHPAS